MEKTIKHELYKHGSYLISLKESGSEFVNIDDEIKKNEELFQLASKKDLQPDLNIKNNNNNPTPWSQIMNDHQPAFAVGEYYFYKSMENVLHILKITAVMGNIVEAGFLDTETGKLINTRIELDKKYVQPATAEQIATFKRAEHFASKGRKLDEFHDRDIVKYEGELFFAKTTSESNLISVSGFDGYGWDDMNADEFDLIQTAEELQEVGDGEDREN